ncbi:MAG TPA: DNA polymerase III subunit delta' [Thermomicrobiales bacterium]|nr:DNA polymerase III subunit delta' [Thermomicrobiales bacterium]
MAPGTPTVSHGAEAGSANAAWPIWGHDREAAALRQAIAAGHISHAYLLSGPSGVGKRALAFAFAQAVLCQAADRGDASLPCGVCAACRRVPRGAHPDVEVYDLALQARLNDRGGKNTTIAIDTVRQLRAAAALRPMEGSRRFIILDDAETMQETAQEALLKTLEEPPPAVTLILLAADAEALLPTIRSRCQALVLGLVDAGAIAAGLAERGIAPERARELAGLAQGRPGWAVRAAAEPALERERLAEIERAFDWIAGSRYDRLVAAVRLGDGFAKRRDETFADLEMTLGVWRDCLLLRLGLPEHVAFPGEVDRMAALADGWATADVLRAIDAVNACLADLESNVRPKLATEAMVLQWPISATAA